MSQAKGDTYFPVQQCPKSQTSQLCHQARRSGSEKRLRTKNTMGCQHSKIPNETSQQDQLVLTSNCALLVLMELPLHKPQNQRGLSHSRVTCTSEQWRGSETCQNQENGGLLPSSTSLNWNIFWAAATPVGFPPFWAIFFSKRESLLFRRGWIKMNWKKKKCPKCVTGIPNKIQRRKWRIRHQIESW